MIRFFRSGASDILHIPAAYKIVVLSLMFGLAARLNISSIDWIGDHRLRFHIVDCADGIGIGIGKIAVVFIRGDLRLGSSKEIYFPSSRKVLVIVTLYCMTPSAFFPYSEQV